jgi:hypothetical protein
VVFLRKDEIARFALESPLTPREGAREAQTAGAATRSPVFHEGSTVGLEYRARLRRAHTPEEVRDRLLHDGAPFVTAAEWAT